MLERLPRTKALLVIPKNKKMKRFVDTSVAANGPLLEGLMNSKSDLRNIILVVDEMLKQDLKFGTRLPKTLLSFSREVASTWDSITKEEKEKAGVDPEFCRQISPASAYFSNIRRGNISFGILLDTTETKRSMIKRWKLLLGLQHGTVPFEEVQEFFLKQAQECLQLNSFEVTKDGIKLTGERAHIDGETGEIETIPGEIKLVHKSIHSNIFEYEERLFRLKNKVANRLIVGYSPILQ